MTHSKAPAWIAVLLAQGLPLSAGAADVEAEARELFRTGNALYEAGRDAEAEAAYEQAWALRPSHDLAANLGLAELNQGKALAAAIHLRFALDNLPGGASPKVHAQLEAAYAKALSALSWLEVRVEPADAVITVDGAGSAVLPEGVAVEPGLREVTAVKQGYEAASVSVPMTAGQREVVLLHLLVLPAPAPSPMAAPEVVSVRAARAPAPAKPAPPVEAPSRVPTFVAAGASLSILCVAVGFNVAANDAGDQADEERRALTSRGARCVGGPAACDAFEDSVARYDRLRSAAVGLYATAAVVGGVAVLLGGGLFGSDEPTTRTGLVPVLGPEAAGLAWSGGF